MPFVLRKLRRSCLEGCGIKNLNKTKNMPDFYVYILQCSDKSYYTGHTDDIEKRLCEHYQGKTHCYTTKRLPVKLVYMQSFCSRTEALAAERKIKGWNRKKKEALMCRNWTLLSQLSRRVKKI